MTLKNKTTNFYLGVQGISTLIFLLFTVGLIYFMLFPEALVRPFVPLHYNVHNGVDLIGPWWRLFVASGTGFLIAVINSLTGFFSWKRDKSIMLFLTCATIISQIFLLLAVIFIVRFNISFYG